MSTLEKLYDRATTKLKILKLYVLAALNSPAHTKDLNPKQSQGDFKIDEVDKDEDDDDNVNSTVTLREVRRSISDYTFTQPTNGDDTNSGTLTVVTAGMDGINMAGGDTAGADSINTTRGDTNSADCINDTDGAAPAIMMIWNNQAHC